MTATDAEYFHFLPRFLEQAREVFPSASITVYDLGMNYIQQEKIYAQLVRCRPWRKKKTDGKYPEGYYPRALHKPHMLYHAHRHLHGPILYLDVDAYPVSYFDMPDCDVAVTKKNILSVAQYANTPLEEYLGFLDAGVIMLGPDKKRELFLAKWAKDMQDDPSPSDQKSLNRVVGEGDYNTTRELDIGGDTLKIHILHEGIYNSSFMHPEAKIVHLRVHEQ